MEGNLAADFVLSFNNQSQIRSSVYKLFRVMQSGALNGIPVQERSLVISGLTDVLKSKNLVYIRASIPFFVCFSFATSA